MRIIPIRYVGPAIPRIGRLPNPANPRVTQSGVTEVDLREQYLHNVKVRHLVSDVSQAVARLRTALSTAKDASLRDRLSTLLAQLVTPGICCSKPESPTHITYLYGLTNGPDQKVGRDAVVRLEELRRVLDRRLAELNALVK